MRPASPLLAAAATISLHAALIGVAMTELSTKRQDAVPSPLAVRVIPERLSVPATAAMETPPPPPVATKKSRPEPRRHRPAAPKKTPPASTPRQDNPATAPPESRFETKPAPPISVAPSASEAASPSSTPPVAPARTRASEANYAASNRLPPYPRLSQINNEEGTVLLRVLVKADGSAGTIEIKKSSGYPLLDKSASTTVQTWRFTPATVNGKPVDEWYEIPIPFKLQNN
jgi:periplasmic protein TonB